MFADCSLVTLRKFLDGVVNFGQLAGLNDLLEGGVRVGKREVLVDRAREQDGLLRHDAVMTAQIISREMPDVAVVNQDCAIRGLIKALHQFGERALSIFIAPPSIDTLQKRLIERATDSPEMIEKRVAKAAYEITFASQFDVTIINDNLETAKAETERLIQKFLIG